LDRIERVVPINDIATLFEKISDDSTYKAFKNAGTIGSIFDIILQLTYVIYTTAINIYKRLSFVLVRMMLESAQNSLPYSVINTKVTEIISNKGKDFIEDFELTNGLLMSILID
jgi:hypothetical protein